MPALGMDGEGWRQAGGSQREVHSVPTPQAVRTHRAEAAGLLSPPAQCLGHQAHGVHSMGRLEGLGRKTSCPRQPAEVGALEEALGAALREGTGSASTWSFAQDCRSRLPRIPTLCFEMS